MFDEVPTASFARPAPPGRRPTAPHMRRVEPARGGSDGLLDRTPRDRGTLLVLSGSRAGAVICIPEDGALVLGRGDEADERFGDESVSRLHAVVEGAGGAFRLRDLGSANGTFLRGEPLRRGVSELRPGDRVRLGGQLTLRFDRHAEDEQRVLRELYESSVRDPLTHLFNRRYLEDRISREVSYARRHGLDLAALMIDIDHFKCVNDEHGHPVGDAVLRVLAAALDRVIRPEDVLARYGGEEFCILGRGLDTRNAEILGERIRAEVEGMSIPAGDETLEVTVSVGVASLREDTDALVSDADEALYRAKAAGRNRVVVHG